MGRRTIHKCDGCGVEHEEDDTPLGAVIRHPRSDKWGSLMLRSVVLAPAFDLCEQCVEKVVHLLELHVPNEQELGAQLVGLGYMAGHGMRHGAVVGRAPRITPIGGALTPEDLEALGIKPMEVDYEPGDVPIAPGVDITTATFTCPKCSSSRDCQSFNPICLACGYQDPDPKFLGSL